MISVNSSLLSLVRSSVLTQSVDDDDSFVQHATGSLKSSFEDDNEYYANDAAIIAQKILNLLKTKEDTKLLQATIVSLGVFLVVLGILVNVIFNVVSIVRRRYTANTLIMISMCTAYLLYLILYCFKLSVYLKDISKYHIYDTIQEWSYGLFMCQFINAFLITCKLISRFSILALCIKRITTLLEAKNRVEKFFNHENNDQAIDGGFKIKILNFFIRLFNLPFILFLILMIWLTSFLISLPVYMSYKLTEVNNSTTVLCDSVYSFPDDTAKYAMNTFNYMIFGLVIPSILIMTSIGIIFAIHCVYDLSINEKIKPQTNWVPVVLFLIHFVTTLPTEIYKYSRLNTFKQNVLLDNDDDSTDLDASFEKSVLETISNPVANARPYYYLQYLYVSEFILIPIVLLIIHVLSTKRVSDFCSFYITCFDCSERDDLICMKNNKFSTNYKAANIDDYSGASAKASTATTTDLHHVTRSLLNNDRAHNDLTEDNVKTISGSGRIKIIRKTSASSNACSTNTTSSGSGANDLIHVKTYSYKPK